MAARPAIAYDNRNEVVVKQTPASIVAEFGRIDGLVNNAGGQFPAFLEAMSANAFYSVVRNNLLGTFLIVFFIITSGCFYDWR